jgi:iron-sulfur cluster assembly protein
MTSILTVTEQASDQLEKIIESAPSGTIGILVGIDKTGCNGYSYKLDFAKKTEVENLEYVQQKKVKVFIDPKATMFLLGSEMDYSTDKLSSRFIFKNPNEKSTCGCGESFGI